MPDKNILHSVSKEIHNKKTIHSDYYKDCNNSEEIAPKCLISEHIIYTKPKYIILQAAPTETDKKKDGQETLTSPERKKQRLSNEDDIVSYSNLTSDSK